MSCGKVAVQNSGHFPLSQQARLYASNRVLWDLLPPAFPAGLDVGKLSALILGPLISASLLPLVVEEAETYLECTCIGRGLSTQLCRVAAQLDVFTGKHGNKMLQSVKVSVFGDNNTCSPPLHDFFQAAGEQAYLSRNVIALDGSSLVIHKDTAVNCYTER